MNQNNKIILVTGLLLSLFILLYYLGSTNPPQLVKEVDNEAQSMTVTVYFHDTSRTLTDKFHDLGYELDTANMKGFATLLLDTNVCEVHVLRIRHQNDYDRKRTLGHEMLHCIYGRWHPGNEHMDNLD